MRREVRDKIGKNFLNAYGASNHFPGRAHRGGRRRAEKRFVCNDREGFSEGESGGRERDMGKSTDDCY